MPAFAGLLVHTPRRVEIMQPGIDLRPHLLLIFILFPLLFHLSHLLTQLLEYFPSHLVHQVLPHYQVLLHFYRLFLSSNNW
jgi:hypothetical protein